MKPDIPMLSNMNAYLKSQEKMVKWKQRQEDLTAFREDQSKTDKQDLILSGILSRYRAGQEISRGDLAYIAEKDPDKYAEIAPVVKKRREIQEKLSRCRSKEEALRVYKESLSTAGSFIAGSAPTPGASVASGGGATMPAMDGGLLLGFVEKDWHYYRYSTRYGELPERYRDRLERNPKK